MRELRRHGRCWTTSRAGRLASPRMRRTSGYARLAPIACGILLGAGGARVQSERWPLTRFAEHDVSVEIALERSRSDTTWIVGTYTPSRATLHLYGKDLPRSGIHGVARSEEHTSELQSQSNLVCRLLLEKKKKKTRNEMQNNRRNTDKR